jgi:hypothetical protein
MQMQYVYLIVFAAAMVNGSLLMYRKRVREAPLRHLARAHAITYMASVDVRRHDGLWGSDWDIRGPMNLIVRSGFIEVSCPVLFLAAAFGMEFYFPAAAVAIETCRGRRGRERIRLTGESAGRVIRLSVASRQNMHGAWEALVAAGAVLAAVPPVS